MTNIVTCKICNRVVNTKGLTSHLKSHSIKFLDYVKENLSDFPNYHKCMMCDGITSQKTNCSRKCDAAWKRTLCGEKSKSYGKRHTKESMDKMIKTLKKRYENKENHGRYGKKFSAESRKKISDSQKEYYKTHPSVFKGRKHTPESIRLIFENKPMNLLEKKVAEYLDTNKIEYTFQFFINESGVCKSYDFKIKHLPLILEIHGDYWHGGPGVKQHVFNVNDNMQNDSIKVDIARKRGYDVISIWESEIKNDINIISTKLTQYLSKKSV